MRDHPNYGSRGRNTCFLQFSAHFQLKNPNRSICVSLLKYNFVQNDTGRRKMVEFVCKAQPGKIEEIIVLFQWMLNAVDMHHVKKSWLYLLVFHVVCPLLQVIVVDFWFQIPVFGFLFVDFPLLKAGKAASWSLSTKVLQMQRNHIWHISANRNSKIPVYTADGYWA